jgi:hypothetical protein
LHKAFSEAPAVGWVRADVAASETLIAELNKLKIEKANSAAELATAQAMALPKIEGIAPIEGNFTIRIGWSEWSGFHKEHRDQTKSSNFRGKKSSSAQLLRLVGPSIPQL